MTSDAATAHAFLELSRRYLKDSYLPKIERCLGRLSDEQIWWRPDEASNSIGNLLLHLCGNARQWVVSGVGGTPDARQRQQEFDARRPIAREDLLAQVRQTLDEVDRVISEADTSRLLDVRLVQGRDVTVLEAIYHVVEHFSMHTGQIIYVTKLLVGEDLGFYEVREGVARRTW